MSADLIEERGERVPLTLIGVRFANKRKVLSPDSGSERSHVRKTTGKGISLGESWRCRKHILCVVVWIRRAERASRKNRNPVLFGGAG